MIELSIQHSHDHQHHHQDNHQNKTIQQEEDEQSHWDQVPCHPHRHVQAYDFSKIEKKIMQIKMKKQAAKRAALQLKKPPRGKKQFYESDVIEEVFQQSMQMIPTYISQALKHRTKFIEEKVYLSMQNDSYGGLISRIKKEVLDNQALANQLNLVMNQVQINIQNDIVDGEYQVHKVQRVSKFPPPEPQPAHRVKLKNMLIRSKIKDLKDQFLESQVVSENIIRSQNISSSQVSKKDNYSFVEKKQGEIWGDQFHLLSQGTRKAQQFIKRMRRQQKKLREGKTHKVQQMQSLEVKSAMQHKQFQNQMRKQKHESLKKRYEEGRLEKKAEKEKQQKIQKDYNNFLKEYNAKIPLFKKKEKEYLKKVIEQDERKRKMKLQEIHELKKPITHEDLIQHMKTYQKLKQQKETQILTQKQMKRQQLMALPKKNYFRGKYHAIIHQQQQELKKIVDPSILRDELLRRQKQFGDLIKKKYSPHISQAKRTQLQQMMNNIERNRHSKIALSEQQMKKLGNEYLKEMKKMIQQLRQKGLIKKPLQEQQKVRAKNYLHQLRDKYNLSSIDYNSQVQSNSQWVHNKAMKLQKDAKTKQKVIRYREQQLDVDKYMQQLNEINENYINAAEAKMCLIKKLEDEKRKYQDRGSLALTNRSKIDIRSSNDSYN